MLKGFKGLRVDGDDTLEWEGRVVFLLFVHDLTFIILLSRLDSGIFMIATMG